LNAVSDSAKSLRCDVSDKTFLADSGYEPARLLLDRLFFWAHWQEVFFHPRADLVAETEVALVQKGIHQLNSK
jgi:hypothetical protein